MPFYSQDGQDRLIAKLFNNKREGYFLDIGAYDGIFYSNTFYLESILAWKGICIEPNPKVFEKLRSNRSCTCLNCCITDQKKAYQFLSITGWGEMLSGILDFMDQPSLARIDKTIETKGGNKTVVNLPGIPLSQMIEEHSIKLIDYCTIDVEGGELKVLKSIDFSKVTIKIFTIENNFRTTYIRKFLRPHGYSLIAKLGSDEVYELNSKRYNLMIGWRLNQAKDHIELTLKSIKNKMFSKKG